MLSIFNGIFWGVFFVLLGVTFFLKVFFDINIPVFRIFFALFFLFLGVRLLTGGWGHHEPKNSAMFEHRTTCNLNKMNEYNIVFGKGNIDLTNIMPDQKFTEINTVFGSSTIKISPTTPTIIKTTAVFAGAQLPDGSNAALGTNVYKNKAYRDAENNNSLGDKYLSIDATVVFGSTQILE